MFVKVKSKNILNCSILWSTRLFITFVFFFCFAQVPDIIDNAYVIVEFDNGSRGMLDLCMFAEGTKNEQEISVVGDIGKVALCLYLSLSHTHKMMPSYQIKALTADHYW